MLSFFSATATGQGEGAEPGAAAAATLSAVDVLVVAVSSVGNVGQLALDLVISSSMSASSAPAPAPAPAPALKLLGWLDSAFHVPMVGHETFVASASASPTLCLPLELYGNGSGVALLQTRSPLLRGQGSSFAMELNAWAKGAGIKRVAIVAGAAPASDEDMLDPSARLWFYSSSTTGSMGNDRVPEEVRAWAGRFGAQDLADKAASLRLGTGHLAHTGISPLLLQACEEAGLPASGLFLFTSEGDNAEDGARLARVLLDSLPLQPQLQPQHQPQHQQQDEEGERGALRPVPLVAPRSWSCLFGHREAEVY